MEIDQEVEYWQKKEAEVVGTLSDDELRVCQGFGTRPSGYARHIA